ncbi:hypothetical protein VaNZ11_012522, partial [Volvox africanus]
STVGGPPRACGHQQQQQQAGDLLVADARTGIPATAVPATPVPAAATSFESSISDKLWDIYMGSEFGRAEDLLVTQSQVNQLAPAPVGEMPFPPLQPPPLYQPEYPTTAAAQPPLLASFLGPVSEPAVPAMPLIQGLLLPPGLLPPAPMPHAPLPNPLLPSQLLPSALPPALLSAPPPGMLSGLLPPPLLLPQVPSLPLIFASSLPPLPLFGTAPPVAAMPTSYAAGLPILDFGLENIDAKAQKMLTKLRLLNHPRMRDLIMAVAACKKLGARTPDARMKIDSACGKVLRDLAVVRTLALQSGMLACFGRDPGLD